MVLNLTGLVSWQPNTWPKPPSQWEPQLADLLETIFNDTMLKELENVIGDVLAQNKSLAYRGHVIAIPLFCAVDALSCYASEKTVTRRTWWLWGPRRLRENVERRYKKFIREHFPPVYRPFAKRIYKLYRNYSVHHWHFFQVAIQPGNESIREENGIISFGLLHFFAALKEAARDFFTRLRSEPPLQRAALSRYSELYELAHPKARRRTR